MRSLLIALLIIVAPLSLPMASAGPTVDVLGGTLYVEVDRNVGQSYWGTKNVYASTNAVPLDGAITYGSHCSAFFGCRDFVYVVTHTPQGPVWIVAFGRCTGPDDCQAGLGGAVGSEPFEYTPRFALIFCGQGLPYTPLQCYAVTSGVVPATFGAGLFGNDQDHICAAIWAEGASYRCLSHSLQGDPSMMLCESSYLFTSDGDCAGVAVTSAPASCAYVLLGRGGADRYPVVCVRP